VNQNTWLAWSFTNDVRLQWLAAMVFGFGPAGLTFDRRSSCFKLLDQLQDRTSDDSIGEPESWSDMGMRRK